MEVKSVGTFQVIFLEKLATWPLQLQPILNFEQTG